MAIGELRIGNTTTRTLQDESKHWAMGSSLDRITYWVHETCIASCNPKVVYVHGISSDDP